MTHSFVNKSAGYLDDNSDRLVGLGDPTVPKRSHLSNRGLVDGYLRWQETANRRSPETLRAYTSVLHAWCVWVPEGEMLSQHRTTMTEFVNRPRKKRGDGGCGSPRTLRRDTSVLRSFYSWVHDEGLVSRNLAGNLPSIRQPQQQPKPIPDAVWLGVWQQDLAPIMRVTLGLGYYVGLRRKEIAELTGSQVGPQMITAFVRKGGGEDTLSWSECLRTATTRLGVHRSRWTDMFADDLLGLAALVGPHRLLSPWTPNPVPQTVNRRLAELTGAFTPHQMRHSFGTNMVKAGVPVHILRGLMNHTSIQTTMGYVHVASSDLGDWLDGQSSL